MNIDTIQVICKITDESLLDNLELHKYLYKPPYYVIPLKQTIHYKSLEMDNYELYEKYIENLEKEEVKWFKNNSKCFDLTQIGKIKLLYNSDLNVFVVYDGIHRLCKMVYKRLIYKEIHMEYLEILYDNIACENIKKAFIKYNQKELYDSFDIWNIHIEGEQHTVKKVEKIKDFVNFTNMNVFHYGCKTGGFLLHLHEIYKGYGIDPLKKNIEIANYMKKYINYICVEFEENELDKKDYEEFLRKKMFDIIIINDLKSMNKRTIKSFYENSEILIIESDNDDDCIPLLNVLILDYKIKITLMYQYNRRKLYCIRKKGEGDRV